MCKELEEIFGRVKVCSKCGKSNEAFKKEPGFDWFICDECGHKYVISMVLGQGRGED